MTSTWKPALEHQFAGALAMLENAIVACPGEVWDLDTEQVAQRFWYLAYHTLFWLDCYLAEREGDFAPPPPYTLGELDPAGVYPDRTYSKRDLLAYLKHGRDKLGRVLASLDDSRAAARCAFARHEMSVLELHLYSLRHVQHHAAQLNLILRQQTDSAPSWVSGGDLAPKRR